MSPDFSETSVKTGEDAWEDFQSNQPEKGRLSVTSRSVPHKDERGKRAGRIKSLNDRSRFHHGYLNYINMLRRLIFLALATLLFQLGCKQGKNKKDESQSRKISSESNDRPAGIKLVGRLSKGKHSFFFYVDKYDDTQPPFEINAGTDTLHEIYSSSPVLLFNADKNQTPYLIYPGETIIVSDTGAQNETTLAIKGNLVRNNELNFFPKEERQLAKNYVLNPLAILTNPNNFLIAGTQKPNFKGLISASKKRFGAEIAFLNNYARRHKISSEFRWFCTKYLYYSMILNELSPFLLKRNKPFSYPDDYLRTVEKHTSDFACDACLNILPYRMAADFYLKFLTRENLTSDDPFAHMWENAKNNFKGKTRNYLLFHLVKNKLAKNPSAYDAIKTSFTKDCTDKNYQNYVSKNYQTHLLTKQGRGVKDAVFINYKGSPATWDSILKKNLGKAVYVDFWASWCVPCRHEIPFSEDLHKKYRNRNIAFIYISIDKKRTAWLEAIKELRMPFKDNYLLLPSKNSTFIKYLKIYSIPRYLLINKSGAIINMNAPPPSEKEINKEFAELLQ